jgi:SAM-dependent methyltransferase
MHMPADVLIQSAGGDRWVLYNVFTLDTLGVDGAALRAIGQLAAGRAPDEISRDHPDNLSVWDIDVFSNYSGLFADPTRRVRSSEWGPPRDVSVREFSALLLGRHLLIESESEYSAFLAPKASLLDRKHAGNFHQQLGQHLLLEKRENPEEWWLRQKFTPDLDGLGNNMYRAVQEPFIQDLIAARFVPGTRVVDLGCGTGYYTRQMGARGAEVIGIDPNPRYIERAPEGAPDNVRFQVADVGRLNALDSIAPKSVDFVFMSDALLFYFVSPDPSRSSDVSELFASIQRILKPSGRFMSLEPHGIYFLRPWLGAEHRPFTVVTEHRERRFNVAPHAADLIAEVVRAGFRVADYRELYPASPDLYDDTRGTAFAATFPLWSYLELCLPTASA